MSLYMIRIMDEVLVSRAEAAGAPAPVADILYLISMCGTTRDAGISPSVLSFSSDRFTINMGCILLRAD